MSKPSNSELIRLGKILDNAAIPDKPRWVINEYGFPVLVEKNNSKCWKVIK